MATLSHAHRGRKSSVGHTHAMLDASPSLPLAHYVPNREARAEREGDTRTRVTCGVFTSSSLLSFQLSNESSVKLVAKQVWKGEERRAEEHEERH